MAVLGVRCWVLGDPRPVQGGAAHLDYGRLAHKNS
jgi:hypothetical protein